MGWLGGSGTASISVVVATVDHGMASWTTENKGSVVAEGPFNTVANTAAAKTQH